MKAPQERASFAELQIRISMMDVSSEDNNKAHEPVEGGEPRLQKKVRPEGRTSYQFNQDYNTRVGLCVYAEIFIDMYGRRIA